MAAMLELGVCEPMHVQALGDIFVWHTEVALHWFDNGKCEFDGWADCLLSKGKATGRLDGLACGAKTRCTIVTR